MKMKKHVKNEEGFTLIEIIAVLVILGILAAVAVPKFIDLQQSAREKAIEGAFAAIKSQVVIDYSSAILSLPAQAAAWNAYGPAGTTDAGVSFGDFMGSYKNDAGQVTVTVFKDNPTWLDVDSEDAPVEIY